MIEERTAVERQERRERRPTGPAPEVARKRRKYVLALLVVGALAAAGGGGWYWKTRPVPIPVKYEMVKKRDIAAAVVATGQVEAMRELDATALLAGVLREVLVEEGDRVALGQPVARLDDSEYAKKRRDAEDELQRLLGIEMPQARHALDEARRVSLPQAQIAIRQAQLNLLDQERNVQMVRQLYENQAESKLNLDSAVAKRDRARLDVDNARQQAKAAQIKVDKARQDMTAIDLKAAQVRKNIAYIQGQIAALTIRSPLAGVVTKKVVNPGAALAMGASAVTVSDTADLRVSASINELEAGKLKMGLPVEVTQDALPGKTFAARIYQISPRAALQDRNEGFTAVRILARLAPGTHQLRPGNTVRTRLILARHAQVPSLPLEAVGTDKNGGRIVFLERDGKARKQTVAVGLSDLRFVEITRGLKPMHLVIVSYGKELEDGALVAEQKDKAPGATAKKSNPHGI